MPSFRAMLDLILDKEFSTILNLLSLDRSIRLISSVMICSFNPNST